VLYRSKLIPRWLSGWGLIGATLFLASAFLPLLSYVSSSTLVYLHLTGAVNQMVLAAWLIVKGFKSSAIAQSKKTRNKIKNIGTQSKKLTTTEPRSKHITSISPHQIGFLYTLKVTSMYENESDCSHKIWDSGGSSAQRGRKTNSQG
jgi:hypothetical protein